MTTQPNTKAALHALSEIVLQDPETIFGLLRESATQEELQAVTNTIELTRLYYVVALRHFNNIVAQAEDDKGRPLEVPDVNLWDFDLVATEADIQAESGGILRSDPSNMMH